MSMLAGPRRKQKVINLRAKDNAWSNDNNKFGQRMLEKMGWSSGKGLGAKEDGIVEHVVARYKNDDKGLGYEDKNDQWTKTEDDFNTLLANLSGSGNELQLHSGVSLEDKSKKSKARIHYHKFTRGKDLSRYSEKDLANIFGKKTFKNKEPKVQEPSKEDITTTAQVFTEKGSMEDYFKQKLAAFKSKSCISSYKITDHSSNETDFAFKGFSQSNNNKEETENSYQGFGFQHYAENTKPNTEISLENTNKAKKRKSKQSQDNQDKNEKLIQDKELENELSGVKIKKKKKKCTTITQDLQETEIEVSGVKMKKCKKESVTISQTLQKKEIKLSGVKIKKFKKKSTIIDQDSLENKTVHKEKKKKKKYCIDEASSEICDSSNENNQMSNKRSRDLICPVTETSDLSKKKKKKNKVTEEFRIDPPEINIEKEIPEKKKKK